MSNVYSFFNFQCAITGPGGSINLGYGAGVADEGVTFDPTGEINTMQIGADGAGQHSLHADRSGKVTVRLLKTSPINKLLSQMYNAQTVDGSLHGQNTISGHDTLRNDSITCEQVAFTKHPALSYGKEAGFVEWDFSAIKINRTLGK